MAKQQYKKPSEYVTFASGWVNVDDEGNIQRIGCKADFKRNAKANKGKAVKIFCVEVDAESGEQTGDAVEVKDFVVFPSNVDKSQYPDAPDFRVFFGVE